MKGISFFSTTRHAPPPRRRGIAIVLFLFCLALIGVVMAQSGGPNITAQFVSAQTGRTWMDVNGAWNGTAVVTGDTIKLTVNNPTSSAISNVQATVVLPTGFQRVGSVTGASVSGTSTLTFTLSPTSIPANGSAIVTFQLKAGATVASGTYDLKNSITYTGGPANPAVVDLPILVQAGDSVISKTPTQDTKAVNQSMTWQVQVQNTGEGGLFNVPIDESGISSALTLNSMTQTAPATPSATRSGNVLTISYLAPGQTFSANVTATVNACGDLRNTVSTTDSTGNTNKSTSATLILDLQTPLIAFGTINPVTLNTAGNVQVSVPINNTGLGDAAHFVLQSNINALDVTVSGVSSGWSYSSSTGAFTKTSDSGSILNGQSSTLTFNVTPKTTSCPVNLSGTIFWKAAYQNECGNPYNSPSATSQINSPADLPSISLSKTVNNPVMSVGQTGGVFTLTLTANHPENLKADSSGNVVVTDTLPTTGLTNFAVTDPGATLTGNTITWTIPRSTLVSDMDGNHQVSKSLTITFDVSADPCVAGQAYTNSATATTATVLNCQLNPSSSASVTINSPADVAIDSLNYDIGDATYQTGNAGGAGAGDHIPINASYKFKADSGGTFTGSTYVDNFGGLTSEALVSGSLKYSINGGTPNIAVPTGSITSSSGNLTIDLEFLATVTGSDSLAGKEFAFSYETTVPDSDLGGNVSSKPTQWSFLNISGVASPGGGACQTGGVFYQLHDTLNIARAAASVSVENVPNIIEKCAMFPVTLHVSNANSFDAYDPLVTFFEDSSSQYELADNTFTYGGVFNAGNITTGTNAGNPTFQYTGNLTGDGTITVNVKLKDTATTTPSPVKAKVDYDSLQTSTAQTRPYNSSGSASPSQVHAGQLSMLVSPQSVNVLESVKSTFVVYITNGGDGTAYNAKVKVDVPVGLIPDATGTNALNTGTPPGSVTVSGQSMSWTLGDIAPGATVKVQVSLNLDPGAARSITGVNKITTTWGCGTNTVQTIISDTPVFSTPDGQIQVVHDTTNSYFDLCETGQIIIIVKNTGLPHLYNVNAYEQLTAGIGIVSGSVQYSTDGGASWTNGSDPLSNGTNAYKWTKNEIPPLADLASPVSQDPQTSSVSEVRIKFTITTTPDINRSSDLPQIQAGATGLLPNLTDVVGNQSLGAPFHLPGRRPDITLTKQGHNVTTGSSLSDTVYGGVGDTVEWQITVKNSGNKEADVVKLTDNLPGNSGDATISINGGAATPVAAISDYAVPNIPAGATHTYTIRYTLGAPCVNAANTASVSWNCPINPATPAYTTPTTNSDSANLVMETDNSTLTISQTATTTGSQNTNNGRVKMTVKVSNNGGPAKALSIPVHVPANLELDDTIAPAISTNNTSGNHAIDTAGVNTLTTATPSGYDFVLDLSKGGNADDGWLRDGQDFTITYYLVPKSSTLDITANGEQTTNGGPITDPDPTKFKYPESTSNGLDPSPPATANNSARVDYLGTCAGTGATKSNTSDNSVSVNPRTPDLDMTVNNLTQTVQTGQHYTLTFFYTITNNGDSSSKADNIKFSLPFIGADWSTLTISGPHGESASWSGGGTPSITLSTGNSHSLSQGGTAIVTVTGTTINIPAAIDLRLVGEVTGQLLKQDNTTIAGNYGFDRAAPQVSNDVNISGYVYLDGNFNGQHDTTEAGLGSTPPQLYAKLIPSGGGNAIAAATVIMSTGAYQFTHVSDQQSPYTVIIDDNNTLTDTTPVTLTGYFITENNHPGTDPSDLVREGIVVGATNVYDQNFGLYRGSKLSGTVFKDTGDGGGIANNGIKDGAETSISGVTVTIKDGSNVLATAATATDGTYSAFIPDSADGHSLSIIETNPAGYISTNASVGNTGGAYTRNLDTITFTNHSGQTYQNADFGDVPKSTFTIDGNKTLPSGGTADFPHVFTAGTAGNVTFTIDATSAPADPAWTRTLYLDANGNGVLDPGETPVTAPIPVTAGQEVHLLIREFAPANATQGAQDVLYTTAELTYANALTLTETLKRSDIATIGTQRELNLQKLVDKDHASSGEILTYTITYLNDSDKPLSNLVINDSVPAFTTFVSAAYGTTPGGLVNGVKTEPAVGALGPIVWKFTGTLQPGQTGTVTFQVKVQ